MAATTVKKFKEMTETIPLIKTCVEAFESKTEQMKKDITEKINKMKVSKENDSQHTVSQQSINASQRKSLGGLTNIGEK